MTNIKVILYLRDLTSNRETNITLPLTQEELNKCLQPEHEYMIIETSSCLKVDEFEDINRINDLLLMCQENDIDDLTLKILSEKYFFSEIEEKIENNDFIILDVDTDCASWQIDYKERYGLYMYEQGYNTFPCKVPEELVDYIDWSANWTSLECSGWSMVRVNNHAYLVN